MFSCLGWPASFFVPSVSPTRVSLVGTNVASAFFPSIASSDCYIYDSATGYYYDPLAGTYYDPNTQVSVWLCLLCQWLFVLRRVPIICYFEDFIP